MVSVWSQEKMDKKNWRYPLLETGNLWDSLGIFIDDYMSLTWIWRSWGCKPRKHSQWHPAMLQRCSVAIIWPRRNSKYHGKIHGKFMTIGNGMATPWEQNDGNTMEIWEYDAKMMGMWWIRRLVKDSLKSLIPPIPGFAWGYLQYPIVWAGE